MANMVSAETQSATAKKLARASTVNSLLLPIVAAFRLNVTFWVLVMANFLLLHAVWAVQLPQKGRTKVDFRLVRWPLIAFGVLGNVALLLWGERLLAVFPA